MSLFKKDNEGIIEDVKSRVIALEDEVNRWVSKPANARSKLDDINSLINELEISSIKEDKIILFDKLVKALRAFEMAYGITPYEDLCKAAVLFNSEPGLRRFFDDSPLKDNLDELVNPENDEIHKSSGEALASCINQRVKAYLQKEVVGELTKGLEKTAFATNQGDATPEQLYRRAMSIKGGPALIRKWLAANITENWGANHGGPLLRDLPQQEKQQLLDELNFYGRSDNGLSQWLQDEKNADQLHCLNEALVLAHAQHGFRNITECNTSAAESDRQGLITSQMVWCNRCKAMLSNFDSEISRDMLENITGLSSRLQTLAIQDVVNTGCIGHEPVYHLPVSLSPQNCKKNDHLAKESDNVEQAIRDLVEMKNRPLGKVSINDEASLKHRLLTAQMELLFSHANKKVGKLEEDSSLSGSESFDAACQKIEAIHRLRSGLVSLQDNGSTALEKVKGVGRAFWQGKEVPVDTRLRNLKLKHQLKLDGYSYEYEKKWIYDRLYHGAGEMTEAARNACQTLANDKANPIKLLWHLFNLKNGVCEQVRDILNKEFFDDFKELMKHNPRLARNMVGDIAQSAAIIKQLFGESSMVWRLFDQLGWRAWGETAQSYVNERFEHTASDYQNLTEKQKTSIKRMFALCEMFKEAPTSLQLAKTGANMTKNFLVGNIGSVVCDGIQGAVELWGVQKVQDDVSAMSDDQVRTLHMALSTLQHGPVETMARLDAMRKSADMVADSIEGRSVLSTCFRNSELMRPFVFRLNRLTHAFKEFRHGHGSGKQLAWEVGKIGLITGGALGVLGLSVLTAGGFSAALGVASLSWSAIGLVTSFSIPTLLLSLAAGKPLGCPFLSAAHAIADKIMHMESLEAPAVVVRDLVSEMSKNPESELKQLEAKLEKEVGGAFQLNNHRMREHNGLVAARQTCLDVYRQHWDSLVFHDSDRAQEVVAMVAKWQADDNEAFNQQATRLQTKLTNWRLLSSFINNMPSDSSLWMSRLDGLQLEPSLKKIIGNNRQQLPYTVIAALEMLQEEVAREMGVELNWKVETVKNSETDDDITLDEKGVKDRLRDYQGRILLGEYLAGNFAPAYKTLSKVRLEVEETVLKVARKRCAEQATALAEFLLRFAVGNLLSAQRDHSGQVDREEFIKSLNANEPIKMALEQQLRYMKKAARHCIKEHVFGVHHSLEKLGIQIDKAQLMDFGNPAPAQSAIENPVSDADATTQPVGSDQAGLAHLRRMVGYMGGAV